MLKYVVTKEGDNFGYAFSSGQELTEFLSLAPHDVVYYVQTVDASKIIDPRRFETYAAAESWNEHR